MAEAPSREYFSQRQAEGADGTMSLSLLVCLLATLGLCGCVCWPRPGGAKQVLDLEIDNALAAIRLDTLFYTPTETVGEKLSHFMKELRRQHPDHPDFIIAVEPDVAADVVPGWFEPEGSLTHDLFFRRVTVRSILSYLCKRRYLEYDVVGDIIVIRNHCGLPDHDVRHPSCPLFPRKAAPEVNGDVGEGNEASEFTERDRAVFEEFWSDGEQNQ